jgi:hypothetical protein
MRVHVHVERLVLPFPLFVRFCFTQSAAPQCLRYILNIYMPWQVATNLFIYLFIYSIEVSVYISTAALLACNAPCSILHGLNDLV